MIGLKAILYDLIPLIPLSLLGAIVLVVLRAPGPWRERWPAIALLAPFLLLIGSSFLIPAVAGIRAFHYLHALRPVSVTSIGVDGRTITDSMAITDVSAAFHSLQWFTAIHGGWAEEVPLRVRLQTGEERTFVVAFYPRERGAVVRGALGGRHLYQTYDCGFSATLPGVLARFGIALPTTR